MSYLLYFLFLGWILQGDSVEIYSVDDQNGLDYSDSSCNFPAYPGQICNVGIVSGKPKANSDNNKEGAQPQTTDDAFDHFFLDKWNDPSKINLPENGHGTSGTPVTSRGKSPQPVRSLQPLAAQPSSAGGQQQKWKLEETVLQSVFHDAANQLTSRPRKGKIYEAIWVQKKGILERLKELSNTNSKPSIDVGFEMADGAYLLKVMNMTTSIDEAETARQLAERGAKFLHQAEMLREMGEELLHECRRTLQSLLNVSAQGRETVAAE